MQEAITYIYKSLEYIYTPTEKQFISSLLIEKITGLNKTNQFINKNTKFSEEQRTQLISFIERLKKNIPLQYVLGETEFYGLKFTLNKSVLIPRPETEELVEWIINDNNSKKDLTLLDIGTGSGCIPISIGANLPFYKISAIDISEKALDVAKKNSEFHSIKVNLYEKNIFNWDTDEKWDIIVSNPPYIPEKEKKNMSNNVLLYEPHEALFVPDSEPLLFYKQIGKFALEHLNNEGKLYFEIHYDKGQEIICLLKNIGFNKVELRKDISENDRMIKAEL